MNEQNTADPFNGAPEASFARRASGLLIDAVTVIGSPWLLLLASIPLLVVTALWVIPLWLLSCAGAGLLSQARRQRNGDRISAGQLITGLTVVRTLDAHRVVRAQDVAEPLRPTRARVRTGRVALSLVALAAVGIWASGGWVYYEAGKQVDPAAEQSAEWATHEPEARVLVDAFITDLLSANPTGGEGYVAGDAKESLSGYRARIRREGVTAFELDGNGESPGTWEYVFREVNPVQDGNPVQRTVSIVVEEVDGRLKVTAIAPGESYGDPAADAGTVSP
ncbi:MAG: hypothetical protein Q7W16_02710 [Coriobacteriia bacterium]|nr:hypothetical protein [Coriobacteriia bacterium]